MVLYFSVGSETCSLSREELRDGLVAGLRAWEKDASCSEEKKKKKRVMLIPPDFTRYHSRAGDLTVFAYEHFGDEVTDIMPALGTHAPVSDAQREKMFPGLPQNLFRVHDWRNDVVTIGHVPAEMVRQASDGKVDEPWPAQLNKLVWEGGHDLVLSIGQVVPHEVMGMANYNKNMFVGVGGSDAINFSHFIGAVYGMERMMGRADNPLRRILNYASEKYMKGKIPVVYVLTVIGRDEATGAMVPRGLFIGPDQEAFDRAAALSLKVNFTLVPEPLHHVVVYLDPEKYHSTWIGNKAVYRTRMAMADGGKLIIIAPGVHMFGEDEGIDAMIRKYGYRTTPEVLKFLEDGRDLMKNLSAAAHLIHASSEGRFSITWCPGKLSKEEVESVGFLYADCEQMMRAYGVPNALKEGWNEQEDGERFFYISNPAVGLWAHEGRFNHGDTAAASSGDSSTSFVANAGAQASLDASIGGGPFEVPPADSRPQLKRQRTSGSNECGK